MHTTDTEHKEEQVSHNTTKNEDTVEENKSSLPATKDEDLLQSNTSNSDTAEEKKTSLPETQGEDLSHSTTNNDPSVPEYPGLRIAIPSVLSVCLAVFLTALVSKDAFKSPQRPQY